ncbi:YicC/YloC family endoribonuclease [Solimicrobium silvestre]|uniref:TIGR00255 family protein n=1 Tax=Solimicrobium silvestre TaxID=2099400 RepID=A0A2S9GXC1_9BURK|nr:YicC/YloC family endoribonuclease [Solimicrobium silvestre]PRC92358.1 hypothetical protein S2091_3017 [Solimicrobium silvestre]
MTGYAVTSRDVDAGSMTIEIKSVNSRFLDLQFRMNDDFRAFEPSFREAIITRITRGKVECRFSFARKEQQQNNKTMNPVVLSQLAQFQHDLKIQFPESAALTMHEMLRWPGVIEENTVSDDGLTAHAMECMLGTLEAFVLSREREGNALQVVLINKISEMEAIVERISPIIPQLIAQFQQKSVNRLQEALGMTNGNNLPTISREEVMDRIRQEVALYGIRIDIAEELTRLSGHLTETRHILNKGGQVGKRLDFMMQELNREANTLGSKAALKELADAAMELKLLIEQMREQVQNLE